jgi:hypothetical protein
VIVEIKGVEEKEVAIEIVVVTEAKKDLEIGLEVIVELEVSAKKEKQRNSLKRRCSLVNLA